jgi:DNA-binding transcriptional regulator GbsR (MarR family)
VVRRFISEAGATSQSLGFGRVVGQIYAFLYFSPGPRSLGDLQEGLGISKGSASMGVRKLEQWEAVRKIWIRGDRKDYYEASQSFGRIIRKAMAETAAVKLRSASEMITEAMAAVNGSNREVFLRERVERLETFRGRAARALRNPVLRRLLR